MRLHLLITGVLLTAVCGSYSPEHVMVDLTNEFGACVLKLVASRTENVAFSPYGLVSVALVLYEGTSGPTAAEIHNSLRLPWDRQVTRIGFRDLHRYLKSYFSNDGFLRGLVLSKPNVVLNWNYTRQLLFYGFDLSPERPTRPPPPAVTTSAAFTLAPTTSPTTVASTRQTTVASTTQTTTVTTPETTVTTEKKPEDTTLAPTTKKTVQTTTAKGTTMPEEPSTMTTEKEVEGKDTDEEIPDAEGPHETTKTNPPPTTEAANPPMTTEAKQTEVQTEQATESKPAETIATTQSSEKATTAEVSTTKTSLEETTIANTPKPTSEAAPQTEPPTSPAQTSEPPGSSEPVTTPASAPTSSSAASTTVPDTVPTTSPPEPTTAAASEAATSPPEPTTAAASEAATSPPEPTTIPASEATSPPATEATTIPPMTTPTANPAATTFMTTPESTTISPAAETTSEAATVPPATEAPAVTESTQATADTTQVKPAEETDNVPSESEMVTRKERALYRRGYDGEHREGIPNWVPHYQDPRWSGQAPLETWFFTPTGGERVPVITYTAYLPYGYLQELEALALQLPLDDPRYYMVILLPEDREGLGKLLYSLQWCPLRGIINQLKTTAVYATIPAFTIVKHVNLVPALAKLGIVRVFDPLSADLTPMASEPGLYVRTIEQVVTVSLRKYFANHRWFDATPGDVEQHFIANHPFVYLVLDRETQVALMTGTIVNPIAHNQ